MSEDFEPSPRSSKRRKINTYGTSKPPIVENNTPASSIWENVSSSVTGLSRRLFASEKSKKSTEADGAAHALREDTTTGREDGLEDCITVEIRSSGRERKRNSRYSMEPNEDQEKPRNLPKLSAKTKASKKSAGVTSTKQPELVGILTPSKKNEKKTRKSVVFDDSEVPVEKDLGFKDISSYTKKIQKSKEKPLKKATQSKPPRELEQQQQDPTSPQLELELVEYVDESLFDDISAPDPVPESAPEEISDDEPSSEEPTELLHIKSTVLARLTHRASHIERPPLPLHLSDAYDTLHTLLQKTVSSGESNSLLLLGSRGSGKSLLVNTALESLRTVSSTDFHIVRLNGFVQTDDRLALREIWKQLGREMEVDEVETNQVVGSFADTMTSLLGLLSQPEEVPDIGPVEYAAEKIVTRSVVFVLDEFDLFTMHPRQTLLYILFDIAQSRKAPIAVVGCSTRSDCVDCLEKRVKSRFSHRWVHVGQPKSLAAFEDVVRDNLLVNEQQTGLKEQEQEWRGKWNKYIKSTFLPSSAIQSQISRTFYTTKSLPDLFAALYIPIATADISAGSGLSGKTSEPPSLLALLPSLPHIHLALVVCATRLEAIHSLVQFNFNIVYAHYSDLVKKSKLAASVSGATASGTREWGRDVALRAWEELVRWEVLVKVGGKDEGLGEDSQVYRIDVSIEEVRWAVETLGAGLEMGLARWCKEI